MVQNNNIYKQHFLYTISRNFMFITILTTFNNKGYPDSKLTDTKKTGFEGAQCND